MNKIVVMIQYVGHVVNAQGSVMYRAVELDLTKEQIQKLKLQQDEYYGPVAIEVER